MTYVNFEDTEADRDGAITTIDTTINELHQNITQNKDKIMEQRSMLIKNGVNFETSVEGRLILKLFDTMTLYQNEVEWRGVLVDMLHTYMSKYFEALEGSKGISQSSVLIDKQQQYLTTMFDSMKEVFKEQVESGFAQRKLEFGALLQRFEFLTDRIRINDVILNKCIDTIKDQKNEIANLAESITVKYEIKKIYTCSHCWKEFDSKVELEEHTKIHQVNKTLDIVKDEQKDIEKDMTDKDTLAYSEQIKDGDDIDISEPLIDDEEKKDIGKGFDAAIVQEQVIKKEDNITKESWNDKPIIKSDQSFDDIQPVSDISDIPDINKNVSDTSVKNIVDEFKDDIKKNREMERERQKHLKMLGKELKKSIIHKNKIIEYLIKQDKYSDDDIIMIVDCHSGYLREVKKRLSKILDIPGVTDVKDSKDTIGFTR